MDEKTAELRDIFQAVADSATVTESQSEGRGTLAEEGALRSEIRAVLDRLAEEEGIDVDLDREAIVDVVIGFYEGEDDGTIASALDTDVETVRRARLDCHLLRDRDFEAAIDVDRLRRLRSEQDVTVAEAARRLDAEPETVDRVIAAIDARAATNATGRRYPDAFESALAEAGLSGRLTASAKRDGLEEATADAEVDTDF